MVSRCDDGGNPGFGDATSGLHFRARPTEAEGVCVGPGHGLDLCGHRCNFLNDPWPVVRLGVGDVEPLNIGQQNREIRLCVGCDNGDENVVVGKQAIEPPRSPFTNLRFASALARAFAVRPRSASLSPSCLGTSRPGIPRRGQLR